MREIVMTVGEYTLFIERAKWFIGFPDYRREGDKVILSITEEQYSIINQRNLLVDEAKK